MFLELSQNVCVNKILAESKLGRVISESRSFGQTLENPFFSILEGTVLIQTCCQNIYLYEILAMLG